MTPPRKGEVWLVNLDPTIGDEIRKTRPAVFVSSDAIGVLALRAVVPLTNWQDKFQNWDWQVRIDSSAVNGLDKASAADAFQVRSLSVNRMARRLGRLSEEDLDRVLGGLRAVFDI